MKSFGRLALISSTLALAPAISFAQHGGSCNCGRNTNLHPTWQMEWLSALGQQLVGSGFQKWRYFVDPFAWGAGNNVFGPSNGQNEIVFATILDTYLLYGILLNENVYGCAYHRPTSAFGSPGFNECPKPAGTTCGTFQETDVILNAEFASGWMTSGTPPFNGSGPAYLPATVTHELGHALGQHHNFANLATMNYVKDIGGQYTFAADLAAARANYPTRVVNVADAATYPFRFVNGAGSDYSQPRTVTLSAPSVVAGSVFVIRDITLEVTGNATLNNTALAFYLSTDRTITSSDIPVGALTFQPSQLPSGSWWEGNVQITAPFGTPPGSYYVGAIVLYNGTAQDSVAYNNTWSTEQRIQVTAPQPSVCTPDSSTLCLNQDRFQIRVDFATPQGQSGPGRAIEYTTDSGFFWFFNNTNLEMMIKVLNACVAPWNKFWVFHAATTNVEYTLTVTDT
ncbi:MAG: hypothetical protein K8F56_16440, partial [Rhodocyclaceae bacterium]|nr:hypothetical protein [Rhodocyclaceae bacterium]